MLIDNKIIEEKTKKTRSIPEEEEEKKTRKEKLVQ
jgi:hypothetical protein